MRQSESDRRGRGRGERERERGRERWRERRRGSEKGEEGEGVGMCGNLVLVFTGAMTRERPYANPIAPSPIAQHRPPQVGLRLLAESCRGSLHRRILSLPIHRCPVCAARTAARDCIPAPAAGLRAIPAGECTTSALACRNPYAFAGPNISQLAPYGAARSRGPRPKKESFSGRLGRRLEIPIAFSVRNRSLREVVRAAGEAHRVPHGAG
jgi:hypothetical protein